MPLVNASISRLVLHERPYLTLTLLFAVWKSFLFCLALLAPGPGYDTSTSLLPPFSEQARDWNLLSWAQQRLASNFVRWDAIYFTQVAKRGYVYEQEWAFGWGHTQLLGFVTRLLCQKADIETHDVALVGVLMAHVFHWVSTLVLYKLTSLVFGSSGHTKTMESQFALLSSILHILSPAGVFLSAPYAEPLFSMLNFAGFLAYAVARQRSPGMLWQAFGLQLVTGLLFGLASTVRGNGLFSGILLAFDAVEALWKVSTSKDAASAHTHVKEMLSAGMSGLIMAVIAILPQFLAYQDFCTFPAVNDQRPWCKAFPPSVYAWVQKEYWGVGFLQYWSVSNIPLFALAAPMLVIMAVSSKWAWDTWRNQSDGSPTRSEEKANAHDRCASRFCVNLVFRLSLPQLLLAVLACTTYHVQVITRLSSGYAVWYWWLARLLTNEGENQQVPSGAGRMILIWMVVYAVVQGSLFASFLPPA